MRAQEYVIGTGRKDNYSFFLWAKRLCTTPEATGGRHHPWHYSSLSLTTNARLRGCRESHYRVFRETWGHNC